MSLWRFWYPDKDDETASKTRAMRDAALWTPQGLAETQHAFWQHTAQATENWWRYWRSLWPSMAQPPAGVVAPPRPTETTTPPAAHAPPAAARGHRSAARAAPASASASAPAARKRGAATAKRARPVARGK
jgi:hypothetical protein